MLLCGMISSEESLINSCKTGNLEQVQTILSDGQTDVNTKCHSAIINACTGGHLDVVKCLVGYGANKNIAMVRAGQTGNLGIVKYLYESGATSRHECYVEAHKLGHLPIIYYFIDLDLQELLSSLIS